MTTHEAFLCTPRPPTSESRNLVVCIDGTSNQFGTRNTNIVELYSHIVKNDVQLTYYSSGLGATAKVAGGSIARRFSNEIDMAMGRNLHKVIMASYRWLSDNYHDGDRIFLFGFSRGAYQVRALAGMIARVGLLLPGNTEQIPFAFELYSKTQDEDSSLARPSSVISHTTGQSKPKSKHTELADTFRKTFCRKDVHIHFVGVWDTVSSVGFGRHDTLPCTTTSCEHICYFRHALALDERRVKFLPEYVYGGRSQPSTDGRIKEVWFAGSHSDIGGGNRRNEKLQSGDIPLLWMRSQAIAAGLELEPADGMWKISDLNKEITYSLNPLWWFLELLPFRRLLYYNSDRHTYRPHFGGPRRILPGQKVHVSALFKSNYKPCARFYGTPEKWPDAMFWNDDNSHQRLLHLSDSWERDIFDDRSVLTLLDALKRGQPNLDALDRLAFMASFNICKVAIMHDDDAQRTLASCLKNTRLIRISAAVIFCELEWDWPPDSNSNSGSGSDIIHPGDDVDLAEQITSDISALLNSDERRRACMYLPSLCKRADLRARLVNGENLRLLIRYCDSARVAQQQEGTLTVAFHSAQALSMLMKLDPTLAQMLIENDAVTDVTQALQTNCGPALVSVLSVINALATHEEARAIMKTGTIIATLLKLTRQFDDFVTPAAIQVLCALLPEADLRERMIRFGVLSTFLDILKRCSEETTQVASEALVAFAQYANMRRMMSEEGHLRKLAERVQSDVPDKRHGAILALFALGTSEAGPMRSQVTEALVQARTVDVLVSRLGYKRTALDAALALARLSKMDAVAQMVARDGDARANLLGMLRHRWFDGSRGEDGLKVLSELVECEPLRLAMVEAGAIDVLREMIHPRDTETTWAGLHYLQVVARFDQVLVASGVGDEKTSSLIPNVVGALRVPHRRVQRIAMSTLRCLSAREDLRDQIVHELLTLLKDRNATVVYVATVMMRILGTHKCVRDMVVTDDAFLSLAHQYYNSLNLEYDERAPRIEEVYASIGSMIKRMQEMDVDAPDDPRGERHRTLEEKWLERGPYELKRENASGPGLYWIATLLCCPPVLLFGVGRRVYRDLWQEG